MKRKAKPSVAKQARAFEDILAGFLGTDLPVRSISKEVERKLARQSAKLSASLYAVLTNASPRSTAYLRNGITHDLTDFWQIGEEHRRRIKVLAGMRFPKDKKRFIDMLYEFEVGLVIHAEYHAKLLKRRLAKLKRDLMLT
jgi:hypothetical protein